MAMAGAFQSLLSPGRIGSMTLRNRIVHAPMSLGLGAGDGTCGDRFVAYYARRAQGGAGLINIGTVSVGYPEGSVDAKQIAASDDRYLPSLKGLADAVHAHGARIVLQLNHNGLQAGGDRAAGRPLATPSLPVAKRGDLVDSLLPEELAAMAAGNPVAGEIRYQVLDAAGIARIVRMFAAAAERAKRAGIDAVEIHGGHGYLLSSFLSPAANFRTDAYGGPAENRARFLIETLRAVREAVGPDFPVWCKIDSTEFELEGGVTIADAKTTARLAEQAGADAISVSAYSDVSKAVTHSGSHTPQRSELLVPNARAIKDVVGVPVITAGRIEAADADRHIAEGHFDFVAFGRKLLADPDLPLKLAAEKPDDVRPCIYCYSCISQAYFRRAVLCTVNPEMGFERERSLKRAMIRRRVAVVGGGPIGMEAALRLKARGHEPVLLERSDRLGGAFVAAAVAYEPNARYLGWLEREIAKSGIDIRLNAAATVETLTELAADAVIVATGAKRAELPITGLGKAHVVDAETFLSSSAARKAGGAYAIIGGGMAGLELAQWLDGHGGAVTILDAAAKFGAGLPIVRRARVLFELRQLGAAFAPGARDIAIGDGEITWRDADNPVCRAPADHVIIATGSVANLALADRLRDAGFTVMTIGDCEGPSYLEGAVRQAVETADAI
jgi:2,4-dienoyl-CoA reductase-like NADH-dependent reductase (Old Yellow Enzyme family)/thioredoxin reductase